MYKQEFISIWKAGEIKDNETCISSCKLEPNQMQHGAPIFPLAMVWLSNADSSGNT